MIVTAIISILIAVTIPQFAVMVAKQRKKRPLKEPGAIRAAVVYLLF